jgi:hypothetical protein
MNFGQAKAASSQLHVGENKKGKTCLSARPHPLTINQILTTSG